MKLSQRERVLSVLQDNPQGLFTHQFFTMNPPILRPAARVEELRKEGYKIITDDGGKEARYVLRDHVVKNMLDIVDRNNKLLDKIEMTPQQYDDKLRELREEWKLKPADRKIIEYRAKLLKMARDEASPDVKNVVESLC